MINLPNERHGLSYYIEESKKKAEYHRKNANNSLKWHNLTNVLGSFITGLSSLTMTIMAVLKFDEGAVAITSGCFSFITLIYNRVCQSYNFQAISIEHHHCSDSFLELVKDFNLLDPENINRPVYELLITKYIEIVERSHITPVRPCFIMECC